MCAVLSATVTLLRLLGQRAVRRSNTVPSLLANELN